MAKKRPQAFAVRVSRNALVRRLRWIYKKASRDAIGASREQPPKPKELNWLEVDLGERAAARKSYELAQGRAKSNAKRLRSTHKLRRKANLISIIALAIPFVINALKDQQVQPIKDKITEYKSAQRLTDDDDRFYQLQRNLSDHGDEYNNATLVAENVDNKMEHVSRLLKLSDAQRENFFKLDEAVLGLRQHSYPEQYRGDPAQYPLSLIDDLFQLYSEMLDEMVDDEVARHATPSWLSLASHSSASIQMSCSGSSCFRRRFDRVLGTR